MLELVYVQHVIVGGRWSSGSLSQDEAKEQNYIKEILGRMRESFFMKKHQKLNFTKQTLLLFSFN